MKAEYGIVQPAFPMNGAGTTCRSAWTRRLSTICLSALVILPALESHAESEEASPFKVVPTTIVSNGASYLCVAFSLPAHHHIYSDRLAFELNGAPVSVQLPPGKLTFDKFSKGQKLVFQEDFEVLFPLPETKGKETAFAVTLQGCNEAECYFPETRDWRIHSDNSVTMVEAPIETAKGDATPAGLTDGFHVAARASGFLGSDKFLHFLDQAQGRASASGDMFGRVGQMGLVAALGLILLGGLALNLTPCVLPMIPINLAVLGAGARQEDRRRGFLLGSIYGAGMAMAYGLLGLVVVLTGSKFGALNSSPWFNFGIALVFIVLSLAMFDKLAIDFSRFQQTGGRTKSGCGAFVAAGVMGSVSALLAGACVAPVVISVLLLAAGFYQGGNLFGLILPFVLGVGMALPWPFAGAGLSFLPKPGAWMTRIKHGFGVVILGFALWYGWLGVNLSGFGSGGKLLVSAKSNPVRELHQGLEESRATGRPVLVDFWASWCKNCEAMEHATFRNASVRQRLKEEFILVKIQAERLNDPALKPVLDEFGVLGLPSFVVLVPELKQNDGARASISHSN